jgi:hypothetical protein
MEPKNKQGDIEKIDTQVIELPNKFKIVGLIFLLYHLFQFQSQFI